ncbi:MAG: hypothetical protein IJM92_13630 [Fibrobacter sp.]|uniref:hypothetical protein n=1 Tax=Fibrobacter sp. TaxID=35828 RepID=UPI0025BEBB69|nr:hypothetical protein [Fibrobacter sp.]MBQ3721263.1 hypothetical protein [Fibrobacter sp.]MBQ7080665.1 hypothetical protein [Fibrobacter sp.]
MNRLTKIVMAVGVAFMSMLLTACPYIAHGTSEAAEFVSLDEVQGCFYGTTLKDWDNQTKKMYCYRLCLDENSALISRRIQYVDQVSDDSMKVTSVEEDTSFFKKYRLNDDYDKDGSLLYSISVDDFDEMSYREGELLGTDKTANFTRIKDELCVF